MGLNALLSTLVFFSVPVLPANDDQALTTAVSIAREILDQGDFQTELPGHSQAPSPGRGSASFPFFSGSRKFALVLFIVLVALLVLWLAWCAWGRLGRTASSKGGGTRTARAVPELASQPALVSDPSRPDELAAQGRYDEAIHALLALILSRIENRSFVAPAWTGRTIAERVQVPDPAREPLRHMISAVEASLFGGRPSGSAEYADCARCSESIDAALSARAAE